MKVPFALIIAPTILATPLPPSCTTPNPPSNPGLAILAQKAGLKYFGTAIDNVVLNNTQYTFLAFNATEFNQVTPSNGQKWIHTEPSRNNFNWTLADQVVGPAKVAGQIRRCHTFVWHSQLPDWLNNGNWTREELGAVLEEHIKIEAGYFNANTSVEGEDGGCYAWDVVNEAFNDDGSMRETLWFKILGPTYIEQAFRWAREYTSPGTKLYYNDYGIERVNNKSLAVQALMKDFLARGVPVDGVGLQAHFTVGRAPTYDDVRGSQALFSGLGLETALTELDVRIARPANQSTEALQAEVYANATRACVDEEKCVGITVWDFWDPVSWVPESFPGYGDACLWRENFERKPAYYAIADVFKKAAGSL